MTNKIKFKGSQQRIRMKNGNFYAIILCMTVLLQTVHSEYQDYTFGHCKRYLELSSAEALDIINCGLYPMNQMNENDNLMHKESNMQDVHTGLTPLLKEIPKLRQLFLSSNSLHSYPAEYSMEKLWDLSANNCSLKSFEAEFPKLDTLLLENNQLTKFPSTIFKSPKLKHLLIRDNSIRNVVFSGREYLFLQALDTLWIDSDISQPLEDSSTTFCQGLAQRIMTFTVDGAKGIPVCVDLDMWYLLNSIWSVVASNAKNIREFLKSKP